MIVGRVYLKVVYNVIKGINELQMVTFSYSFMP